MQQYQAYMAAASGPSMAMVDLQQQQLLLLNPMMAAVLMQQQQQMHTAAQSVPPAADNVQQVVNAPAAQPAPIADPPAANNVDDVDDAVARDVLDYAYLALRAAMLLVVLYYYSSTVRVFAVLIAALLMWAMQRARHVPQLVQQPPPVNAVQNVLAAPGQQLQPVVADAAQEVNWRCSIVSTQFSAAH